MTNAQGTRFRGRGWTRLIAAVGLTSSLAFAQSDEEAEKRKYDRALPGEATGSSSLDREASTGDGFASWAGSADLSVAGLTMVTEDFSGASAAGAGK